METSKLDRVVLLIDILGFSNLVIEKGRVAEVYEIINSLNAHSHPSFKTTVFSDTIVITNEYPFSDPAQFAGVMMWLCEFPQELFYRLVKLDLHFRGYITKGEFHNSQLKNVQAIYGSALVKAHQREMEIQCTGLFVDNDLVRYMSPFKTTPYDTNCHFVHLMQSLELISCPDDNLYPLDVGPLREASYEFSIAYDLRYIQNIYRHMNNIALEPRVRLKYAATWLMLESRHRSILRVFERSGFDPRSICDFDWSDAMERVGTDRGIHG